MNNAMVGVKRVLLNKNVVTILLVIAALGLLFWGYSYTIKKETSPVQLPVAAKEILPRTQITGECVEYATVPEKMLGDNVLRNNMEILDLYTNINVTIPKGSPFYREWLVPANKLPGNWIEQLDIKKGELGYYMTVDIESTLGNNVLPGSYIDLYMSAEDENGTIMIGRLLQNIKVLVVHDGSGADVFDDPETRGPSKIGFAVNQDLYLLLQKIDRLGIELILAPRGYNVPNVKGVVVKSSTLKDFVDAKTITVEEDEITEVEETTEKNDNKNKKAS